MATNIKVNVGPDYYLRQKSQYRILEIVYAKWRKS